MPRVKLTAKKRETLGRQVKNLRQEGILPANLYGRDIESQAIKMPKEEFVEVFREVGESGLIDLKVGRAKPKPVLASNVQFDPVSDEPIHVDFRLMDLTEKTAVEVPIELVGQTPAVEQGEGILIQPLQEIEVEALPEDLPDHITVDVSSLEEIDDTIRVEELEVGKEVTLKAESSEVVAKVEPPIAEEEVAEPEVPEEGAVEEGVAGEVGEEGEPGEAVEGEEGVAEEAPPEEEEA